MRPRLRSSLSITASQASMHWAQPMHSICRPLRMSMPVGHTVTHAPQSTQSPAVSRTGSFFFLARGSPRPPS